MRKITKTTKREGKYGPFYIVNFDNGDSCIVAEKKVINPLGETLEEFGKKGTKVKFNDGHYENVGETYVEPIDLAKLLKRVEMIERYISDLEDDK